jgi:glycosyltransferase involved in cell wall biosynthesis
LFDQSWYVSRGGSRRRALAEYYLSGYLKGRSCNYLFDERWYLRTNPDVLASGTHPLVHYIQHGEKENRNPSPLFDVAGYRQQLDSQPQGLLLAHFLREGARRGLEPTRYFETEYYLRENEDVRRGNSDPYFHYLFTGYREGRAPGTKFNFDQYSAHYGLGVHSDSSPLAHYLYNRKVGDPQQQVQTEAARSLHTTLRDYRNAGPGYEKLQLDGGGLPRAKVVAMYLPQFHCIPENDEWWGEGFTEWTNVARGLPRFAGHYQPHLPGALGYYDLRRTEAMAKQVALAKQAAIEGFCFYYYNFSGRRLLEHPIDLFLSQKDWDLSFCLMWANENWTRTWDGLDSQILIKQDFEEKSDRLIVADVVRHMRDARYIRIGGRPLFFIYRPGVIPQAKARIAHWRELFAEHGEHPLIFMAQGFGDYDPAKFGLDGAIEFPPHKHATDLRPVNGSLKVLDPDFTGSYFAYDDLVAASVSMRPPEFPLIRTALPTWDNEARRPGRGMGFVDSTPEKFERWLRTLIDYSRAHPVAPAEHWVLVKAWNEWAEAAHLEPDLYWGHAYLNATKRAITGSADAKSCGVIVVGHDAHRHGAQFILLNIVKTLVRKFGVRVEMVLLEGGALEESFREHARTHVLGGNTARFAELVRDIQRRTGAQFAICNTVVTGHCVEVLKQQGIATIALVHELANLIRERRLDERAKAIARHADRVVFPSAYVRNSFEAEVGALGDKAAVQPQGLYLDLAPAAGEAEAFRRKHGIPLSAKVVINLGFGDLRKGYDIFVRLAASMTASSDDTYFVWIGEVETGLARWLQRDVEAIGARFVQLPFAVDPSPALAAADVFCLTSREDPFPSVLLEALALGVPIAAFDGAGGYGELFADPAMGRLSPYGNVDALAASVRALAGAEAKHAAPLRRKLVAERFDYGNYAFSLMEMLWPRLKRVSVVVPSYNCAAHLGERLETIFAQRSPIYELIILDDASTDASLDVIRRSLQAARRDARIVVNERNSGSAFHQWELGASLARGSHLWMAEADDAAAPGFLAELALRMDDDVALAFSDSSQENERGELLARDYQYHYATVDPKLFAQTFRMPGPEFVQRALAVKNFILNVSGVLFRRDEFCAALARCREKMLAMKVAGDWLLYVEALAKSGKQVVFLAESLNVHRRHGASVTSTLAKERHLAEVMAVQDYVAQTVAVPQPLALKVQEYRAELKKQFMLDTGEGR